MRSDLSNFALAIMLCFVVYVVLVVKDNCFDESAVEDTSTKAVPEVKKKVKKEIYKELTVKIFRSELTSDQYNLHFFILSDKGLFKVGDVNGIGLDLKGDARYSAAFLGMSLKEGECYNIKVKDRICIIAMQKTTCLKGDIPPKDSE